MQERITAKRFELATDPVARTRLDNFRFGVKEFQKKYPEVSGVTVFGSMIKGEQAKATSDVDGFLYVDAEKITDVNKLQDLNTTGNEYRTNFLRELKVPENETSKYYGDFRPKLLSSEILDREIDIFMEDEISYNSYRKMLSDTYETEMPDEERDKLYEQAPSPSMVSPEVIGMFHARIGSGVEKYRRLFLEKIVALPDAEMAQKIWQSVSIGVNMMEERSDHREKIKIPLNLNDALRIYHTDLFKSILKKKDEEKIKKLKIQINNLS